jgi:hypothetical protein
VIAYRVDISHRFDILSTVKQDLRNYEVDSKDSGMTVRLLTGLGECLIVQKSRPDRMHCLVHMPLPTSHK